MNNYAIQLRQQITSNRASLFSLYFVSSKVQFRTALHSGKVEQDFTDLVAKKSPDVRDILIAQLLDVLGRNQSTNDQTKAHLSYSADMRFAVIFYDEVHQPLFSLYADPRGKYAIINGVWKRCDHLLSAWIVETIKRFFPE